MLAHNNLQDKPFVLRWPSDVIIFRLILLGLVNSVHELQVASKSLEGSKEASVGSPPYRDHGSSPEVFLHNRN